MSIVLSDVVTAYGSYYKDEGQGVADLYKKLYRPSATAAFFNAQPTKDTRVKVGSSELDRVLQPFQKAFTPIGTLTFKSNVVDLFNLKIDKSEYPDEIVDSWLGFLEGEGIKREEWPFVRWMIEVHVLDKMAEDYELNEAYAGIYVAPTPGTAGAAGTSMNGIKKQFTDYGARINTVVMGAAPTDPVLYCTYIETFVESLPFEYRKRIDYVFMSETAELLYKKGKRIKYNVNYAQVSDLMNVENFPNARVQGLASMGAATNVWATLPWNRFRPIKKKALSSDFVIKEYSPRAVSLYTDWWEVLGFKHPESVFKSDVV